MPTSVRVWPRQYNSHRLNDAIVRRFLRLRPLDVSPRRGLDVIAPGRRVTQHLP